MPYLCYFLSSRRKAESARYWPALHLSISSSTFLSYAALLCARYRLCYLPPAAQGLSCNWEVPFICLTTSSTLITFLALWFSFSLWKRKSTPPFTATRHQAQFSSSRTILVFTLTHRVPSLPKLVPHQQSCHSALWSHPSPAYGRTWNSKFPSWFLAVTKSQRTICLWQVTNEVIQPDFHCSQAWRYKGHGEEGKTPRAATFPSPDETDATTQRISSGPLVFLLSLLWLSTVGRKELFVPCPLRLLTDTVGQRLSGEFLLPVQGSKRNNVSFQINQQKSQALIHTANHLGEEWEEITQGRPLSSDFCRHFVRHWGGWSLPQFNSKAFMANYTPCRIGSCEYVRISHHLRDGKRPMTKTCASGRHVWTLAMKNPVVSDTVTFDITWYYSTESKKWLENECILWDKQLLCSLLIGCLNVFSLFQTLSCDGVGNDMIFATFCQNWASTSITREDGWEAPGARPQAQDLKQFVLHFPHSPFILGFSLRMKENNLHNLPTAQWRP